MCRDGLQQDQANASGADPDSRVNTWKLSAANKYDRSLVRMIAGIMWEQVVLIKNAAFSGASETKRSCTIPLTTLESKKKRKNRRSSN